MKRDLWLALQAPASETHEARSERSPLLDAKVMMVDDEPLMTDVIQAHLEDEGYANFVVTNDPRDAMAMLRRENPGVLLLDLMMPGISGYELLEAIRADADLRYTPVIVLTAATGADAKLRALQLGATDFLSKPVDASELVLRVRNTLAFRQYHTRLIHYDPVTGLPNAPLFDRGIAEVVARRPVCGGMAALLAITVGEYQQLREGVGQNAADALARTIASRLETFAAAIEHRDAICTPADRAPRVARLGGGHFGVLLEGIGDAESVEAAAKRVLALLSEPLSFGAHEIVPTACIGIAVAPGDGDSAEALRQAADLAASAARETGRDRYKFSSPELNARSYEKLTLGSQLRGAARRGELRLHYQPKVDIRDNRIVGAEALVRWQHPDLGLVPPGRFIALAEELGIIESIGQWVLETACADVAAWSRAGLREIRVAVNVAKPQFVSGRLCAAVRQALFDTGVPARQLIVELTESMLMDDIDSALALMHELKGLGVTLSIDDFGTGYSSLSYLKRFPLDELKIDRSFITDLPGGQSDLAIVRTVVDLGHRLGLSVIAEGIETDAQLDCLRSLGCDHYQGFLYSRPVPPERFVELLAAEDGLPPPDLPPR